MELIRRADRGAIWCALSSGWQWMDEMNEFQARGTRSWLPCSFLLFSLPNLPPTHSPTHPPTHPTSYPATQAPSRTQSHADARTHAGPPARPVRDFLRETCDGRIVQIVQMFAKPSRVPSGVPPFALIHRQFSYITDGCDAIGRRSLRRRQHSSSSSGNGSSSGSGTTSRSGGSNDERDGRF